MGFGVWGFGFRVSDFGFWFFGFRFRISGFGFRVSGFGFRVQGAGCRVLGLGLRVEGLGFWGWGSGSCDQGVKRGAGGDNCPRQERQKWETSHHKRPFVGVSRARSWSRLPAFVNFCKKCPRLPKNLVKWTFEYPHEGPCVEHDRYAPGGDARRNAPPSLH